jgi:hypothetical protein
MDNTTENITTLSKEVIGALADAFGKSVLTIERWVESGNLLLTSDKAKEVFKRKGVEWPGTVSE